MKKSFLCVFLTLACLLVGCKEEEPCGEFGVSYDATNIVVAAGETLRIDLSLNNVETVEVISVTQGWSAQVAGSVLSITAPATLTENNRIGELVLRATCPCGETRDYTIDCTASKVVVLTFEDTDAQFPSYTITGCGKSIGEWSDLIDDVQYGGALLYNDYTTTGYCWHDAGNTELASAVIDGGPYWNGGHAVSDYYNADYSTATYETQLEVSTGMVGAAGHNGSKNFCVQNGYVDENSYKTVVPYFYFADGVERVVKSMYIVNTNYVLNSLRNGDSFSTPATDATWYKIVATGYSSDGTITGTSEFMLCNGKDNIVDEWTEWNLSALGKVLKIEFNLRASDDLNGQFGLTVPSYFAYDDVTVIM